MGDRDAPVWFRVSISSSLCAPHCYTLATIDQGHRPGQLLGFHRREVFTRTFEQRCSQNSPNAQGYCIASQQDIQSLGEQYPVVRALWLLWFLERPKSTSLTLPPLAIRMFSDSSRGEQCSWHEEENEDFLEISTP